MTAVRKTDTPKIFRITLEVSNIDEAAAFYAKLLGTEGKRHPGARHYFDCGGVILAVLDPTAGGLTSMVDASGRKAKIPKRAKIPNVTEKTSPCARQTSRPNTNIPVHVIAQYASTATARSNGTSERSHTSSAHAKAKNSTTAGHIASLCG